MANVSNTVYVWWCHLSIRISFMSDGGNKKIHYAWALANVKFGSEECRLQQMPKV